MQLIQTGLRIGQAVKNVQRLKHVLAVFARHGFEDVVHRMSLGRYLPARFSARVRKNPERGTLERLRLAFEELGPTWIKLGQLLSTRPDLIPEAAVEEFTKLQDSVQTISYSQIRNILESELKRPIAEVFSQIDETPLAAASIAQVHAATLISGMKVVIKVQRPDIRKAVETDVSLLFFFAGLLEKYVPESKFLNPKVIVEEFLRTITLETSFLIEANNIEKITRNLSSFPEIVIPSVIKTYSTEKILVMERIEGIRLSNIPAVIASGADRKKIVELGARAMFKSILIDGLFHGDLHGGNLFLLPGNRLGIIDFGIVGRLSLRSRGQLANMLVSLLDEDFENLCYQYADLGNSGPGIDFDAFQREVRNALAPHMGLSINQVNSGQVLIEATKIAARYQIRIPGDWMLVFKAIFTVEGLGRKLDPTFDIMSIGKELSGQLVSSHYSLQRMSRDALWVGKDLLSFLQILPRNMKWLFRSWALNKFAFEIKSPDLSEVALQLNRSSRRISLSLLIAAFVLASVGQSDLPMVGRWVLLGLAGLFLLRLLLLR